MRETTFEETLQELDIDDIMFEESTSFQETLEDLEMRDWLRFPPDRFTQRLLLEEFYSESPLVSVWHRILLRLSEV